jgi:hypothetical protein
MFRLIGRSRSNAPDVAGQMQAARYVGEGVPAMFFMPQQPVRRRAANKFS